jgi:hypothetical protein
LTLSKPDVALLRAMKAVERAFPGLLTAISKEVQANVNGILRKVVAMDANHPQVENSACLVAAKLALAAYYDHHGKAAPTTSKINTMWTNNQNPHTRPGVFGLLDKMNQERFLKQGRWDTQDTFYIRFHADADAFLTVAVLHESIALMANITDARRTENWEPWQRVWSPVQGQGLVPFVATT